MDIEHFELKLDQFGSNLDQWPDDERRVAIELREQNPSARLLLQNELALVASIEKAMFVPIPYGLKRRILDRVQVENKPLWLEVIFKNLWRPIALAVIPVAVGFVAGAATQESYSELNLELVLETFSDFEQIEDELL